MTTTVYQLFLLIASIGFIIWLTAYKKLNPFFALLLVALGVGFLGGLPADKVVNSLKAGFGHTMEKVGLLIILGTTLGVLLQKTGATTSMAAAILKLVKERNAPAAIALTGFVIGIPIFCDSGFIILSGLNHALVQKAHQRMPVMAAALATSLYAVHCLVPPHPGITAAVATAGGETGMVMLWGLALALPAAVVGYVWSVWRGKGLRSGYVEQESIPVATNNLPPALLSFVPVVLPILLIAIKSIALLYNPSTAVAQNAALQTIAFAGEPVIALAVGVLVSFALLPRGPENKVLQWLSEGVEKAGMILAIIAAGGVFGEVLQATGIGKNVGLWLGGGSLGVFFPFLMAAVLKTAQGSSTVAVITAASLVTPLLPTLGLDTGTGLTLALLGMGAGSMMISHANDAYFWVIGRFSSLDTRTTLRVYSTATVCMGLTVQLLVWFIHLLSR